MARKQQAVTAVPVEVDREASYRAALARGPLAPEIESSVRSLAAKLGVDSALPPRERAKAVIARLGRSPKPLPKECHWDVLRGYLAGERNELAAVTAAEGVGLGIKAALAKAAEGWTASGPPKRERVPGEDDE